MKIQYRRLYWSSALHHYRWSYISVPSGSNLINEIYFLQFESILKQNTYITTYIFVHYNALWGLRPSFLYGTYNWLFWVGFHGKVMFFHKFFCWRCVTPCLAIQTSLPTRPRGLLTANHSRNKLYKFDLYAVVIEY